jgi:hypothetical protein
MTRSRGLLAGLGQLLALFHSHDALHWVYVAPDGLDGAPLEKVQRASPRPANRRQAQIAHTVTSRTLQVVGLGAACAQSHGATPMPLYRFGLNEENLPGDQNVEWHPNDVAALAAAARTTAASTRARRDGLPIPMMLAFRVKA